MSASQASHFSAISQPSRAVVFRNVRLCAFWAVALAGSAMMTSAPSVVVSDMALLAALYAMQAFASEALGVRYTPERISAPRRLSDLSSLFVVWRHAGEPEDILEVLANPTDPLGHHVEIVWANGVVNMLLFANRDDKIRFFRNLRALRPSVGIYRAP